MKKRMNHSTKGALLHILVLMVLSVAACTQAPQAAPTSSAAVAATADTAATLTNTQTVTVVAPTSNSAAMQDTPGEIVVYAADLPEDTLYELEGWEDATAAGGMLLGVTNNGDELDAPPENDPHATFTVQVQAGIPYRCWLHMLVGTPKGKSTANVIWAQFSNAVDQANQPAFQPESASFLTAQGPEEEGWHWVECAGEDTETSEPILAFSASGDVTVRLQAGMEGVGFDQFLLSPAQFLEGPPTEAIVAQ